LPPEQSIFLDLAYHAPKGRAKTPVTVAAATASKKGAKKAAKKPDTDTATNKIRYRNRYRYRYRLREYQYFHLEKPQRDKMLEL